MGDFHHADPRSIKLVPNILAPMNPRNANMAKFASQQRPPVPLSTGYGNEDTDYPPADIMAGSFPPQTIDLLTNATPTSKNK